MALHISTRVSQKLTNRHKVSRAEIVQCFINKCGGELIDTREQHKTDPPTRWFVSTTDAGRSLKVVCIYDKDNNVIIKSCFPPEQAAIDLYRQHYPK